LLATHLRCPRGSLISEPEPRMAIFMMLPPSLIEVTTTELCAILSSIIHHGLHRYDFLSIIGSRAQSEKPLSVGLCRQAAIVPVKNVRTVPQHSRHADCILSHGVGVGCSSVPHRVLRPRLQRDAGDPFPLCFGAGLAEAGGPEQGVIALAEVHRVNDRASTPSA